VEEHAKISVEMQKSLLFYRIATGQVSPGDDNVKPCKLPSQVLVTFCKTAYIYAQGIREKVQ
jgi:hypothetical protein